MLWKGSIAALELGSTVKYIFLIFIFAFSSLWSSDYHAWKELYDLPSQRELALVLTTAEGNAISMTNTWLIFMEREPVYCVPPNLVLNEENYANMIIRQYERNSARWDNAARMENRPVDTNLLLIVELTENFPCS